MRPCKSKVYCTFYDAPEHVFPGHPESPQRLNLMQGWLAAPPYPELEWLDFAPAEEADVLRVHRPELLEKLQLVCLRGPHEFEPSPSYVTKSSYKDAFKAVGATLAVSRRILAEGCGRGFAIVRPPGHHAEPNRSMGFCLLNNIAIAAAEAITSGLKKVAILDFDAHHGNGTQAAFWNTSEVGYLSTHEDKLFPGSGQHNSVSHARGRIINIPLPGFSTNAAFHSLYEQIAGPWLRDFGAEMLFVSAGFDIHFSDPLTTSTLDTSGFYELANLLVSLADDFCEGRIMFVLEGGYDPRALKDNVQACLAALSNNYTFSDHYGKSPGGRSDFTALIEKIKDLHQIRKE